LFEEALQVASLVVEELNLFLALFGFHLAAGRVARLDRFDLAFQLNHFV